MEFGISCNYHKGYRARHIALEQVQGKPVESYNILPSYLYMLEHANPGTFGFDVDQFPCAHALACIRLWGFSFVYYFSPYYPSAFLVIAYSGGIHPIGQPSEWLVSEDIASKIVHPPVGRRGSRRHKQNRTRSFGKELTQKSCTTCHRVGHNSHTCTYPKSSRPSTSMGSISEIGEAS
ncbi:hypothetical protein Ddye_005497 [Dipteronia dyeriana]|uniref:Uncharacterized protein n=1 Tax=Dipteronia dyeriana TaxID=168575 RepID=A0AAD9XGG3_9ROSI|nr:hypothetical protein Ddye_005497 [Dipteronia dyeriana]